MRIIHVLLHRRPELFSNQVHAIVDLQEISKYDLLVFSVDGGDQKSNDCFNMANACAKVITEEGLIDTKVVFHKENLGVANHPKWALGHSMEMCATLAVFLEDDALPKRDWLRMCLWWKDSSFAQNSGIISGSNHHWFGRGKQSTLDESDPSIILESPNITSPFCWATVGEFLPDMKKMWNYRNKPPLGWDWSLSTWMLKNGLVSLHPILSRCQNVGRTGGVHETPETFDNTQLGLHYAENYDGTYRVIGTSADIPKLAWKNGIKYSAFHFQEDLL